MVGVEGELSREVVEKVSREVDGEVSREVEDKEVGLLLSNNPPLTPPSGEIFSVWLPAKSL